MKDTLQGGPSVFGPEVQLGCLREVIQKGYLQGHLTGCHIGNGEKLRISSQAEPGQAVISAVAFPVRHPVRWPCTPSLGPPYVAKLSGFLLSIQV